MRALADRAGLFGAKMRNWAAGPLAVRVLLFLAGLAALGLAAPEELLVGRFTAIYALGAAVTAMAPRGRLPSVLILVAGSGWLASTTAFHQDVVVWKLLALASAMYLVHVLAALAAVLPYDAVLPPGVVGGWLFRAALALAVSAGLGLFAMIEAPLIVGPVYLLASIAGVIVVGILAWFLATGARR